MWLGEEGRKAFGEAGVDAGRGGEEFWGGAERPVQVLSQSPQGCPSQAGAWSTGCTWELTHPLSSPAETAGGR